jgi:hypothetical protein
VKYRLHPACAAWPPMSMEELCDLAADIEANGLIDAITLTPNGLLLDGRNRVEACEIAEVEISPAKIEVHHGDPWLFSLSNNKHRRHMTADQVAMVASELSGRPHGDQPKGDVANAIPTVAQVAAAAGVRTHQILSANTVRKRGTPEEVRAVKSGAAKLRKTASAIRARTAPTRKKLVPPTDPMMAIVLRLREDFNDNENRTVDRAAKFLGVAKSALREALGRFGDAVEWSDDREKFRIMPFKEELRRIDAGEANAPETANLKRELAEKNEELRRANAQLRIKDAEIDGLERRLGERNAQIRRLENEAEAREDEDRDEAWAPALGPEKMSAALLTMEVMDRAAKASVLADEVNQMIEKAGPCSISEESRGAMIERVLKVADKWRKIGLDRGGEASS